jgi:hypothetical protein
MARRTNDLGRIERAIVQNKATLDGVKVTSIKEIGFNSMEGTQYQVGIKLFGIKGYKDMLFSWFTNSSWLDDYYVNGSEDTEESTEITTKQYNEVVKYELGENLADLL